jgi:hypothetical protein
MKRYKIIVSFSDRAIPERRYYFSGTQYNLAKTVISLQSYWKRTVSCGVMSEISKWEK